jgi:hypothetical protein
MYGKSVSVVSDGLEVKKFYSEGERKDLLNDPEWDNYVVN